MFVILIVEHSPVKTRYRPTRQTSSLLEEYFEAVYVGYYDVVPLTISDPPLSIASLLRFAQRHVFEIH